MSTGTKRTFELLKKLSDSKKNLADTLTAKGENASNGEPLDDLHEKAGNYVPKTYILVSENGNETPATLISQETLFDATENDVREGKAFVSDLGAKVGTKVIPAYHTTESLKVVTSGRKFEITNLKELGLYQFTKLQAIICDFNTKASDSVSAVKVAINGVVYEVQSTVPLAEITINETDQTIDLGITNETNKPQILRYFTYKEIE